MTRTGKLLREVLNRIGEFWCRVQHPAPRWPINGQYECPTCLRRYAVVWANDSAQPEPPAVPRTAGDREAMPAAVMPSRAALAARL